MDWIALYKLGRLALLAMALLAIGVWLFSASRSERLEATARRMLDDGDLPPEERG
jgi:hypothetical protein